MRRHSFGLALLLVVTVVLQGCATTALGPSVLGRSVIVVPRAKEPKIQGELLAVDESRVIVSAVDGIHEVPVPQISEVRVRRHSLDGKKGWTWTLVGAAVTGIGLTAACASVKASGDGKSFLCAGMGAASAVPWILFGGLSAGALDRSAFISFGADQRDQLLPYARYPQGLPPEFDLRGNIKPPATKR